MNVKLFTVAHVPEALQQKWLQHLRDFDIANPGCHFQVAIEGPEVDFADAMKLVTVNPKLNFTKIWSRAKWAPGDEP
jgi:hypothetical protein